MASYLLSTSIIVVGCLHNTQPVYTYTKKYVTISKIESIIKMNILKLQWLIRWCFTSGKENLRSNRRGSGYSNGTRLWKSTKTFCLFRPSVRYLLQLVWLIIIVIYIYVVRHKVHQVMWGYHLTIISFWYPPYGVEVLTCYCQTRVKSC